MLKSLIQLFSASLIAQLISFSIMPIITRLYSAEAIGEYQFFTTLALVIMPFVTGSLDLAMKGSQSLYRLLVNLKLAVQYSFLVTVALLSASPLIIYFLENSDLEWFSSHVLLLILFVYLSANSQIAISYFTNKAQYIDQVKYTVTKSGVSNSLKLFLNLYSKTSFALIWSLILTEIFQIYRFVRIGSYAFLKYLIRFRWEYFKRNIIKNSIYPTFVTMTTVVGVLRNWFPILVTGYFYGPKEAGLLGLAFMVVNTPVYPFIMALQSIAFGELSREKNISKYVSVYIKIFFVALIPSVAGIGILGFYGDWLFSVIFGKLWAEAGSYAFVCFIPVAIALIISPMYNTLNIFFSFQRSFFIVNCISLIFGVLATIYVSSNELGFELFLKTYAIVMSFNHIFLFILSLLLTSRHGLSKSRSD